MKKIRFNKKRFAAFGMAAGMSAAIMAGSTAGVYAQDLNSERPAIEQNAGDINEMMKMSAPSGMNGQFMQPVQDMANAQAQNGEAVENMQKTEAGQSQDKPADNVQAPTDNGQAPSNDGQAQAADNGQAPTDNGQTSTDNGQVPTDNGQAPADNGQAPTADGQPSADNGQPPADNGQTMENNGQAPADTKRMPSDNAQGGRTVIKKLVDDIYSIIENNKDKITVPDEFMSKLEELKKAVNSEAPTGEAPTGEAPTGEKPADAPELPTGEAPTGEAPTGEKPADAPELPTGEAPTGEAPTGEAPTGEKPADAPELPTGEAPTGEAPTGEKPTGEAPTGEKPADAPELPTGEAPTGEAPTGEKPADAPELPSGEAPTGEAPTGEKPADAPELPAGEAPTGEVATGEAPTGEKPADAPELPSAEAPTGQAPTGERPSGAQQMPSGNPQSTTGRSSELPGFDPMVSRITPNTNGQSAQRPSDSTSSASAGNTKRTSDSGSSMQPGQNSGTQPGQSNGSAPTGGFSGNNQGGAPSGAPSGSNQGMPGGQSQAPTEYSAANKVTADSTGNTYESSSANENAVLADKATATLSDVTVNKTGDASGEDADFYGINAAVLASNGSDLTIKNANVTTNGTHANGVFSYGSGTTVNISDSAITTTGNNSGGIMTTGGATLNATNLTVNTSGNSSAAIRSDRGGGKVTVSEGTYKSTGTGSPAIYSTADITVSDATLEAGASEAVVIEGGNSVNLKNVDITGNNSKLNGQSTVKTNVLIYQSMSGDASEGSSTFTMEGGKMTALTGSMFHVTNVTTTINLKNVTFDYADDSNDFAIITKDSWGSNGKNGGNVSLNLAQQKADGNITVDSISSLTLNIKDKSTYTGAINSSGAAGTVKVSLESGSKWVLTGDSYITSFDGDYSGIDLNGHSLYINGSLYKA